jgi:hypothetical protein
LELPVHDIPDGSERVDPFALDSERVWAEENGINIMGTPLGTPAFVSSYLQGKGLKHLLLLDSSKTWLQQDSQGRRSVC